jgi:transposase
LHAGNKDGLIEEAALAFSSNTKNPDYHGEMNQENFLRWFENQLLISLQEPSLIIMDNASYHRTSEDKCPNNS